MRLNFFTNCKSKAILFSLATIAVLCFWLYGYRYHTLHQELFTLFLFSPDFFLGHLIKPGGLTDYMGLFLIQFFRYVWVGALLQTASFIALWYLTRKITRHLGILPGWEGVCLLPALNLLGMQMQYEFVYSETLKAIFYFALFYGYIRIASPRLRLIVSLISLPVLLMLLGGGMLIGLYVLFLLFELCFAEKRIPFMGMAAWLILVPVLPQVYKQIYLVTDARLYDIFPAMKEISFSLLKPLFMAWLPLFLLGGWGFRKFFPASLVLKKNGRTILNLLIALVALWGVKEKCYYPKVEMLFHAHNAVIREEWDEVLNLAKKYDGTRNSFIALTNMALAQKGRLAEDLFDYPQVGINGLLLPWDGNYFTHLYGHEVYYHLGQMNAAFRWIYEAFVCKSEAVPPQVAQRVVENLLKLEKYDATKKYLYLLAQTLFYQDWAKKTLRTLPGLGIVSSPSTGTDFIVDSMGPFYDLVCMAHNDPKSKTIRDYLLTGYLLEKSLPEFYAYFTQYYPAGYITALPKVYEEALIVVYQKGIDKDVLRKYQISQACMERFQTYSDAVKMQGLDNPETPGKLKIRFGNTYWYYYHFVPVLATAKTIAYKYKYTRP